MDELRIRDAIETDLDTILGLIRELAEYERLSHEAVADRSEMRRHLFGPRPKAEVLIAEWLNEEGPDTAGFALFFHNFSTFVGKPGVYLEDLYVRPTFRERGIGRAMLARLAAIALERGCGRLEWSVLDWNQPARAFYKRFGAVALDGWTANRLSGDALGAMAASR